MENETCIHEGCDRPVKVKLRGMCFNHYQTWAKNNLKSRECSVEGCTKRHDANGFCRSHGNFMKRYGQLSRPLVAPRFCECGRATRLKSGECVSCRNKRAYWEGPQTAGRPKKAYPSNVAIHLRLNKARGRAALYECVECGEQAANWSLNADAKDVVVGIGLEGLGSVYSFDLDDYSPRCDPCHRRYDSTVGWRKNTFAPRVKRDDK